MVSAPAKPDSELFCTASSTQKIPERHPSALIPGGHTSPLRHPTVLRPGAGHYHHHRKASSEGAQSHVPQAPQPFTSSPKPATYKAYSPPATPTQDPRASVVANEIEGYFAALDILPLQIKKQHTAHSSSSESSRMPSPIQRCASPPVPPKIKMGDLQQLSPPAELPSAMIRESQARIAESDSGDLPPAYEEAERIHLSPEKPDTVKNQHVDRPAAHHSSIESTAVPAEAVEKSVQGADAGSGETVARKEPAEAIPGSRSSNDAATKDEHTEAQDTSTTEDITTEAPPLPPRPTSISPTPQPDTVAQMQASFPPPPRRRLSLKGLPSKTNYMYVPGSAATAATAVGAAVAIPSTDFAQGGLAHARQALGQRVSYLIDRAKEHHEAKRSSDTRSGMVGGKERSVLVIAPIA